MSNNICPECNARDDFRIVSKEEKHLVKGEPISLEVRFLVCNSCEAEVYDEKLDTQNLINAYDKYREKKNLLSPVEIVSIRNMYELGQKTMSKLLGWGEITLHRYESGAIQDEAFNKMLLFAKEPENMMQLAKSNNSNISDKIIEQLILKIGELLKKRSTLPELKKSVERYLTRKSSGIEGGYRMFNTDKFINMVLFFASEIDDVLKVKMNKLLWYADFLCFKEHSLSCSGGHYTKMEFGPVSGEFKILYPMMEAEKIIGLDEVIVGRYPGTKISALSSVDLSDFKDHEKKVLKFIAEYFRDYNSTQMKNISHKEEAYKKPQLKEGISYDLAHSLSLSLPK